MKSYFKRISASILALFMVISLIPASISAAPASSKIYTTPTGYDEASDVRYSTNDVSSKQVIANWGARGEDCVFLSTYAQNFYTGSYDFDAMSALNGGTSQSNASSSQLYSKLQELMTSKHTYYTSYGGSSSRDAKNFYKYTDCVSNDTSKVALLYIGGLVSSTWDSGKTWNQEHVWPQSKLNSSNQEGDIAHLRPAKPSENSSRGNKAYGEASGYYNPGPSVRGDCARTILYMYVRWGLSNTWGSSGVMQNVDVLLAWMEEDPVDTWEMGRNDAVQSITGTRNVFVDYPEYAWLLFGQDVPEDMITPSDSENVSACSHTYTSNKPSGTVATAATCTAPAKYYVKCDKCDFVSSTLTVVSGAALGHSWVNATCTAPKTCSRCKITEGNALGHTWIGATCTAPQTCLGCNATQGNAFGHTDDNGDKTCDTCGTNVGSTTPPAVTGNTYVKVTEAPSDWSGQYLIVYEGGWCALDGSLTTLDKAGNNVAVAIKDNTITLSGDDTGVYVTIAAVSGGYSIKTASGYYIGSTSNTSNMLASNKTTVYTNTLSINADKTVNIKASGGSYMRFNVNDGTGRFRYFKSSSYTAQKAITLYKLEHQHSYTSAVTTKPTCTQAGVTTYTCSCGGSYTTAIAATGHTYDAVVTAPTCTAGGYTTYTCACGDTYVGDEVAVLGHKYDEGVITKEPTYEETGIKTYTCGVCGNTYTEEVAKLENKPIEITRTGRTLLLEDIVQINFYYGFAPAERSRITGAGMYIWKNAADAEAMNFAAAQYATDEYKDTGIFDGKHEFSFTTPGIPAKEMGDMLYMVFYFEVDGRIVYTGVEEYSARTWCVNKKNDSKEKNIAAALMNYGAAAQVYFGYKTDALMNEGFASYTFTTDMLSMTTRVKSTGVFADNGMACVLEGAVEYKLYYKGAPLAGKSGFGIEYRVGNKAVQTIEGFTYDAKANEYYVVITGIAAKNLDEAVTVTPYYTENGEKVYGESSTMSAESWIYSKMTSTSTSAQAEKDKAFAPAFGNYIKAANERFK